MISNAFPQQSVCIVTDTPNAPLLKHLGNHYKHNGYLVRLQTVDSLLQDDEVYNLLIVDLDTCTIRDTDDFCEFISERASRVLIVCSTSFQRLIYYRAFECYTSYDNLLSKEFFIFQE